MYHKPTSDTLEHGENCYQTVIKRWISALCCYGLQATKEAHY